METYEKDNHWRFYLHDNPLTKDNTKDCIAEVIAAPKTLWAEDIAKEIKRRGSELEYETILSVISQHNRIIIENLLAGARVMTDICQFSPRITGIFASKEALFDANIHKLVLDIVLSKNMREDLKKVKTINMGLKPDVAHIGLVTDSSTGLFDGSITPDEDIEIEGSKIKIVGNEGEEAIGLFFVATDGTETKVTRRLVRNEPSLVIVRVPNLADGEYTLRIVTRFSQSNVLLKEPRVLNYEYKLVVGKGSGSGEDDRPVIE